MLKVWDRVVVNEPDMGIVNAKGTVVHTADFCGEMQNCTVKLDNIVGLWPFNERCFLDRELTLVTNKA